MCWVTWCLVVVCFCLVCLLVYACYLCAFAVISGFDLIVGVVVRCCSCFCGCRYFCCVGYFVVVLI